MSDPWVDIRHLVKIEDLGMTVSVLRNTRRILADADALLVVVDYVTSRRNGTPSPGDYVMIPIAALDLLLAALPEHLRKALP